MSYEKFISEAKQGLNRTSIETSLKFTPELDKKYRRDLASHANSSIIKRMIERYEENLIGK
jgi:hypothetical protein